MPGWLKGCLIALAVFIVIACLLVWWVARNMTRLITGLGVQAVEQVVDASDLPAAEKLEVKAELKRLSDAAENGEIGQAELQKLGQELVNSPLLSTFVIFAVEKQYFDNSGLTDEEKENGRVALRRVVHGAVNKQISQAQVDQLMNTIMVDPNAEQKQLKEKLTDEELRAFLEQAKTLADNAEVPEEVPEVDPSDELKRIIDAAVGAPAE